MDYFENHYAKKPRIVDFDYRERLQSFQLPAIEKHFGSLEGKVFADIGCGDIPLAYCQDKIGRPSIYWATDLSEVALNSGKNSLVASGVDISNIRLLHGPYFCFNEIPDRSIDCAFSNSLFSHLSLNTILICLKNLEPKLKRGSRYFSSMILLPPGIDSLEYEWQVKYGRISHSAKDPFHYVFSDFRKIVSATTGLRCVAAHPYGHPFQLLVEFAKKRRSFLFH